jgi:hypothetical protein
MVKKKELTPEEIIAQEQKELEDKLAAEAEAKKAEEAEAAEKGKAEKEEADAIANKPTSGPLVSKPIITARYEDLEVAAAVKKGWLKAAAQDKAIALLKAGKRDVYDTLLDIPKPTKKR